MFDRTPRRNFFDADIMQRSRNFPYGEMQLFAHDLANLMFSERCCQNIDARKKGGKFIVVNAWNEWGEGMSLEPSNIFGRLFLEIVKKTKAAANSIGCDFMSQKLSNITGKDHVQRHVQILLEFNKHAKLVDVLDLHDTITTAVSSSSHSNRNDSTTVDRIVSESLISAIAYASVKHSSDVDSNGVISNSPTRKASKTVEPIKYFVL